MKIIESAREGMQGLSYVIPTKDKVQYINTLLKVGFDTVEIGSIVSKRLIPQLADTLDVISQLDVSNTLSRRMVLVVNKKGAEIIAGMEEITDVSYPFSISPEFLKMNLNSTIIKSKETVREILDICQQSKKEMVLYISMAFGNPYGDDWSRDLLADWVGIFQEMGVKTIALSNVAIEIDKIMISETFSNLIPQFPEIEFGLHLHTSGRNWDELINAAYSDGCRRFDAAINGMGGCPMSGKEMLGNLNTENLLAFCENKSIFANFDLNMLKKAYEHAHNIFHL